MSALYDYQKRDWGSFALQNGVKRGGRFGQHRFTRIRMEGCLNYCLVATEQRVLSKLGLALLSTACSVRSSNLDDNGIVEYSLYGPCENINFESLVAATRCVQPKLRLISFTVHAQEK